MYKTRFVIYSIDLHLCESRDGGVYTTGNIADTYDDIPEAQQWVMYIYSEDDWLNGLNHPLEHEMVLYLRRCCLDKTTKV